MTQRLWQRDTLIAAIRAEASAGHDLSYSRTEKRVPSLLRAAERVFGHWGAAVEAAGFDYTQIRKYRVWTRARVVEKILYWQEQEADLSWRNVSESIDPPLAAAALHAGRFVSWNSALRAAGIDPESVSRYRKWTPERIMEELTELAQQGVTLDQDTLLKEAPALLAAIYRLEGSLVEARQSVLSHQKKRRANRTSGRIEPLPLASRSRRTANA